MSVQQLGSISSTHLRAAFAAVAPQSVRTQSSCQYLFTLLGSTRVKAVRGMLMKLSPDDDNGCNNRHLIGRMTDQTFSHDVLKCEK